ncbi:ribosome biogenesis GTPase YqeH [Lactobacillus sp. DCY120]|uniref:Ribosome biogenesis GTPase YqeH n=1 Tax=Bombilactobacillus apium TaxID=2675299 RepID=A0A850R3F9_9LACO|nr:ribosome biogenesis GTPase YqeH [Bombilactobacillus apium]NVY96900.1 ribosome biogenesis GTPase YqeH [Bombilactobacillus apium]
MTSENELSCIGCGAILQTETANKPGFLPAGTLKKYQEQAEVEQLYCQRCFRLRHYNEIAPVEIADQEFKNLLRSLRKQRALIVYVVDVFNFSGSLIPNLDSYIGSNRLLLVGNKTDLLPHSFKVNRVKNWLQQQAKRVGLKPLATKLVSAKKLVQVDQLLETIEQLRQHQDVYIIGTTNVGKSTLLNAILQARTTWQELITTSSFPGTTLDQIKIPLADGHNLIDTPGIVKRDQMAHFLLPKQLKYIAPQTEIHPRIFQLQAEQTLFIAGLARLDFIEGSAGSFLVYVENHLYIHRTKLENADDFYQRQLGELLNPPQDQQEFPPFDPQLIKTTEPSDILLAGLGWISVPQGVQVRVYLPVGLTAEVRPALVN